MHLLEAAEALMLRLVAGPHLDHCGAMAVQHLSTGGKRLRASLAIQATLALGGREEDAVSWAAACELLHNASLVHDDLQDGDRMRRGMPTTWAVFGPMQAINAGDLMLVLPPLALEHMVAAPAVRWELSRALSRSAADTVRGQAHEMTLLKSHRLRWMDYLRAAEGKTAAFFALPVQGAALLTGRDQPEALGAAFAPIGTLFQLQDDLLDLTDAKGHDARGSDLREGKVSALVVEHLALHPEDRPWLLSVLETPRAETRDDQVEEAIARFHHGGAVASLRARIQAIAAQVRRDPALLAEPALHALALTTLDALLARSTGGPKA
ncbi:MAG: polyprenyl synthetase family protein [Deltaproteobacteria bacterium]|nr:polyprenyl synthetase family protein [Deltaproteobacteria bacterium]